MKLIATAEDTTVSARAPAPAPAASSRTSLRGTPQQEAFWDELIEGSRHVLLEARAGTGKSTSCREGMWRLIDAHGDPAIRYCCFNKKVADEFAAQAPPAAEVGTMHRFGLLALKRAFNSKVDAQKTYLVLDAMEGGPALPRYVRKSIAMLVGLAKNHGLHPDAPDLATRLDDLAVWYDVETWRRHGEVIRWAREALTVSAEMTAVVEVDDMLWLAVLHPVRFPGVDFLFIDECQDLNPVQHMLAERQSGSGRTVVVGDPYQSIYAFRGADCDSIPRLRDRLDALVMLLTVSFRCPRGHVELARQLVPDFEAAPEAPEGELVRGEPDLIDAAPPGGLVLCRANAPLISACLKRIARLVPAVVRGRSIGDQLLAVYRKVGDVPTVGAFGRGLDRWLAGELGRLDARDGTDALIEQAADKAAGLHAIASACSSPAEIPGAIGRLFADDDAANRVTFSSVHRAKGSEARDVTYLQIPFSEKRDRERPPQSWELQQRKNLRYVALSRSSHRLTLV